MVAQKISRRNWVTEVLFEKEIVRIDRFACHVGSIHQDRIASQRL
jgi:hypothetical protein